jgi:DNA-nicking Smr family endonuclease
MDFGEILEAWEKRQPKPPEPGKTAPRTKEGPARKPEPGSGERPNPLTEWLRLNPVYDKDAEAGEAAAPGERRRRLLRKRPDAVLDLHGLSRDEAWNALELFFEDSRRRGLEKVLIVHGKGNHSEGEGVLRRLTARFVENCPFAGESGQSPAAEGGSGAAWVILKAGDGKFRA